jgi:pilus assembly protein CpaE
MEEIARVVLALEEHDVAEEVMHFLDRTGRARVVATASDEHQLSEAVRQLEPEAVVASPGLATAAELNGSALLALDTSESVSSLRGALRAGARGFFLWPGERGELARAVGRLLVARDRDASEPGRVLAVYGARGGAGTTFLGAHLAAAFAKRGQRCVLVDLDVAWGDVASALGVSDDGSVRSIGDALSMGDELTAAHMDRLLLDHAGGFRVLLPPSQGIDPRHVVAEDIGRILDVVRRVADVVVLHLPRGLDDLVRLGLGIADRILIVLQLDVSSFRAAQHAIEATRIEDRCDFVVNRNVRREITPRDVERVFGRPALAVIPSDRRVPAAQDRGRLLPARGRAWRSVHRLAGRLLHEMEEAG